MSVIRNIPLQKRAQDRLESLRSAARAAIAEKGVERFSTSDIARISGASIGTVYRYYPDSVAVLDDLYPDRQTILVPHNIDDVLQLTYLAALTSLEVLAEPDSRVSAREKVRTVRSLLSKPLSFPAPVASAWSPR